MPKANKTQQKPTYMSKHHNFKPKPNKSGNQQTQNNKPQTRTRKQQTQTSNPNSKTLKQSNRHKLNPNNQHNIQTYTQYITPTTLLQLIGNKTTINHQQSKYTANQNKQQ